MVFKLLSLSSKEVVVFVDDFDNQLLVHDDDPVDDEDEDEAVDDVYLLLPNNPLFSSGTDGDGVQPTDVHLLIVV